MAVTLTVSQIRQELWQAAPQGSGRGAPSTPELGTLFHQVLSALLSDGHPCSLSAMVRELDADLPSWKSTVRERIYDHLVGPMLTQQAAAYHGKGRQVLNLWSAVQAACDLLADLWWEITAQGTRSESQAEWFSAERQVVREFKEPGWSEPVAVVGQIDAVLQIPQQSKTCVLEWKLGKTSPELDVAQAALYRLLLDGDAGPHVQSSVAVVGFLPEKQERLFSPQQLASTRQHLMDVIYRLAQQQRPAPKDTIDQPKRPVAAGPVPVQMPDIKSSWYSIASETILKTLRASGSPCKQVREPIAGPAFVRFFVYPERGVKPNQILKQGQNLQLPLGLDDPPPMRITEGMIGIDLPRPDRQSIPWSQVSNQLHAAQGPSGASRIPVGVDLMGNWEWCDLSDSSSAHLLVVGTPGSGKTQWLRSAVASLVASNTPETLELILIDPKQNAFQFLHQSPFLGRPIVVPDSTEPPAEILRDIVERMGHRNSQLASAGVQSLQDHVAQTGQPLARTVIVCDEYADLLAACASKKERDDLELQFRRIAQVGRAPGFHLILATQQPRTTVLSASIRALIPAKVVLRVTQPLESRVAMDQNGAESLLGNGDLYYQCIGTPQRLQGPWLPKSEESLVVATEAALTALI